MLGVLDLIKKHKLKQHLQGFFTIGVHVHWAAAHVGEAPRGTPAIEDYISEISNVLSSLDPTLAVRIYLATDSHEVVAAFQKHFDPETLIFIDAIRGKDRQEPHLIYENAEYWRSHAEEFHQKKPGYRGGLAVLLDCLLLSRAQVFIHSSSNVAEFVSFFNPRIESVYLPKIGENWPCRYGL